MNISQLNMRLECARQLIVELGNKKFEQDEVIASMKRSFEVLSMFI